MVERQPGKAVNVALEQPMAEIGRVTPVIACRKVPLALLRDVKGTKVVPRGDKRP
jgi:hypothetical protein